MIQKPSLAELRDFPRMARWFNPALLSKLLLRVIIADVFGQYADRRLLEAALDTVPASEFDNRADITQLMVPDETGAVWIDFVADLGDGFDATYAIAYALAQEQLTVGGETVPKSGALIMGGDEVYPTASRENYHKKMLAPYRFASPDVKSSLHPPMFMIPGNHDWYDGLVTFLAIFCREKPTRVGNWRTHQRRSYFALKLADHCWLWGIDIALVADMDQPQADYFVAIAKSMPQGANIILCSAEPGWYKTGSESYRTLSYAAWIAENAGKALRIPLVLSGDTHHYSRYSSSAGTQYITSGGGGAFLHGTHALPEEIHANWLREEESVLVLEKRYPEKEQSQQLLMRNLAFAWRNWDFAALLGAIYSLFGFVLTELPRYDVAVIIFAVLATGFTSYSGYQEKWAGKVIWMSLLHSSAHFAAMVLLSAFFVWLDGRLFALHQGAWWAWLLELSILMVPVGGFVAGTIFGIFLLLTCRFADINHNDAFSSMQLDAYRGFLRIRIFGDTLTVYPIGLDRTPARDEWQENPKCGADPKQPFFVPCDALTLRLIEPPIFISGFGVAPTTDVKTPGELKPKT